MSDELRARFAAMGKKAQNAAVAAAKAIAAWQNDLIKNRLKPDGSAQHENDTSYRRRQDRKNKPPLYRTGRLMDHRAWRVGKPKDHIRLRPPKDREPVIGILHTHGYRTVFDREFHQKLAEIVQAEINKAMKNA